MNIMVVTVLMMCIMRGESIVYNTTKKTIDFIKSDDIMNVIQWDETLNPFEDDIYDCGDDMDALEEFAIRKDEDDRINKLGENNIFPHNCGECN